MLVAYAQVPPLNAPAGSSSKAGCLKFGLRFSPLPYLCIQDTKALLMRAGSPKAKSFIFRSYMLLK